MQILCEAKNIFEIIKCFYKSLQQSTFRKKYKFVSGMDILNEIVRKMQEMFGTLNNN